MDDPRPAEGKSARLLLRKVLPHHTFKVNEQMVVIWVDIIWTFQKPFDKIPHLRLRSYFSSHQRRGAVMD